MRASEAINALMDYIASAHGTKGEWRKRKIELMGNARTVAQDTIDDFWVSTVRLTADHGWGRTPLLYETMVFQKGSWSEVECDRYSTEEEARAGHKAMCERVRAGEFKSEEAL